MLKFVFKSCALKSLALRSLAFKPLALVFKSLTLQFLAVFIGLLLLWPQSLLAAPLASGTTVQWSMPAAPNPEAQDADFARAFGPQDWQFPQDFGPHPQYQTEWWYYTGNLSTPENRPFGFQLTFFRQALTPVTALSPEASPWRTPQLYSAHFTVSDIEADRFYQFERFSRGAVGLAGAQSDPYGVWLQDWHIVQTADGLQLTAQAPGVALTLGLHDTPPVLQGDRGFSAKADSPGNASQYYSQVQQPSQGRLTLGGTVYRVTGQTWMDHEFATQPLSAETQGWDWFSVELDDGGALMLCEIRRQDGSREPLSYGLYRSATGVTQSLSGSDFSITVQDHWTSPQSGVTYPDRWSLTVPSLALSLKAVPQMANQELLTATAVYWEGAVQYRGTQGDRDLQGQGYVELTGYADPMTRLLASP